MKKYVSFFRMRLMTCLQYRASYVSGLVTQLPWGLMECFAYLTLHQSASGVFPMELASVIAYIWLKEAFFVLFTVWNSDNDIFESIVSGAVSYEMCRPLSIYNMWFARAAGGRFASLATRSLPILIVAFLLPAPFRLMLPRDFAQFALFLAAMLIGVSVTLAFCMIIYMLCFFTISPKGIRRLFMSLGDLLSGSLIPLPFVPQPWRGVIELLPFASMQNTPFLIYTGELMGLQAVRAIGLQGFWLVALILLGKMICEVAQRHVAVQGG